MNEPEIVYTENYTYDEFLTFSRGRRRFRYNGLFVVVKKDSFDVIPYSQEVLTVHKGETLEINSYNEEYIKWLDQN